MDFLRVFIALFLYVAGMRFFRNFHDLRGHSCGNRRSNLIFMGGGGTIYSVCSLSVSNAGTAHYRSSQATGVYTMSIFDIFSYNVPDIHTPQRKVKQLFYDVCLLFVS